MRRIYCEVESFECPYLNGNKSVYIQHQYAESDIPGEYVFRRSICSGMSRDTKAEKQCSGRIADSIWCSSLRQYPQEAKHPPFEKTYVEYDPSDS